MANKELIFNTLFVFSSKTHLKGFKYLETAIGHVLNNQEEYRDGLYITKSLYPYVAKQFGTSPSRVERSIRHYINISYDINSTKFKESGFIGKPTNSEFISTLSMILSRRNNYNI